MATRKATGFTLKETPEATDLFPYTEANGHWVQMARAAFEAYIDTVIAANAEVAANTLKVGITTDQANKIAYITVTQAVDLDQMETDIAALANGMVYKGDWDASSGSFPGAGSAKIGWFYNVSVGGTVDGVEFTQGDSVIAKVDNASTTTYAANWVKKDQTDAVQSVAGLIGTITASALRAALNVEDGATADQSDAEIETAYNNQVAVVSQVDAEAGTSTTPERWTPERVAQAIAALAAGGVGAAVAGRVAVYDSEDTVSYTDWKMNDNWLYLDDLGFYAPGANTTRSSASANDSEWLGQVGSSGSVRISALTSTDTGTRPIFVIDIARYVSSGVQATIATRPLAVIRNNEVDILDVAADGQFDFKKTIHASETDDGNSGSAKTIDFGAKNFHKVTLTDDCTFTFTAPGGATTLMLKLVQDGTGSRLATFPASVLWQDGTAPTLSTGAAAVDLISLYWDGTNYHAFPGLNMG